MKKNLSKKVMLSVLAGSMLFGNTVSVFAADAPQIVDKWETNSNYGWIAGGYSENEVVSDKTIVVTDGTAIAPNADEIDGGYSINGAVKNNTAIVSGGTHNIISGGTSEQSDASGNSAVFSGESTTAREVFGADSASGNVSNNSVELTGGHVTNAVVGGRTTEGNASNNSVMVTNYKGADFGSAITQQDYENLVAASGTYAYIGGYIEEKGDAIGNKVNLKDSQFAIRWAKDPSNPNPDDANKRLYIMEVVGGCSENGDAIQNGVEAENIKTNANILGGGSHNGNVSGNWVKMSGDNILYTNNGTSVVGGCIDGDKGSIDSNTVSISGKLTFHEFDDGRVDNKIAGGMVDITSDFYPGDSKIDVTNNIVNIDAEILSKHEAVAVYGGYADAGKAVGNKVNAHVKGDAVSVIGGYSETGNVENNSVIFSGNGKYIYGGYVAKGDASGNTVTITEGTVNGWAYGAVTGGGDAVNNTAILNGGYVEYIGGAATDQGNENSNGAAINNKVLINGGAAKEVVGGEAFGTGVVEGNYAEMTGGEVQNIYGGSTSISMAQKNYVKISGGIVTGSGDNGYEEDGEKTENLGAYGAIAGGAEGTNLGALKENVIEISGDAKVSNAFGAYSFGNSEVVGNAVILNGGEVTGGIVGGYSNSGKVSDNVVNVNSAITSTVYGGKSESGEVSGNIVNINAKVIGDVYGGVSGTGVVKDNIITLLNDADVSEANLYGAEIIPVNARMMNIKAASTPNGIGKLVINGWGGEVNSLNNFSEIQFNNVTLPENGSVVTIKDAVSSDLSDTTINASKMTIAGGTDLSAGSTLNLMTAENANDSLNIEEENVKLPDVVSVGVAQEADGKFVMEDGKLVYKVEEVRQSSQTKLIAENRAVAAAFVNQGTDLITDSLSVLEKDANVGVKTFAAVHGNRSKYDVNSDLKINGWSSLIGVGNDSKFDGGDLNWGVFFENGSGNYRTYNSFNNEFFRGDGSLVYNGGGAMIRYNKDNGFYTEASLRAGTLKSEIDGAVKDSAGNSYGYKSDTTYYGAHIGFGKVLELNDSTELDVYGKFFHTYNDSDSFEIAGDKFEFDSVTSDRLRVGARLNTNKAKLFNAYYGLAWEYEFNGDADMKTQNTVAPNQSLGGSSFMGEIGVNYKPGEKSPWSFDLSLRGYAGEREGMSSNLQANYSF